MKKHSKFRCHRHKGIILVDNLLAVLLVSACALLLLSSQISLDSKARLVDQNIIATNYLRSLINAILISKTKQRMLNNNIFNKTNCSKTSCQAKQLVSAEFSYWQKILDVNLGQHKTGIKSSVNLNVIKVQIHIVWALGHKSHASQTCKKLLRSHQINAPGLACESLTIALYQ